MASLRHEGNKRCTLDLYKAIIASMSPLLTCAHVCGFCSNYACSKVAIDHVIIACAFQCGSDNVTRFILKHLSSLPAAPASVVDCLLMLLLLCLGWPCVQLWL